MAYAPIWKDRYVTLAASGNSAAFEIRTGSSSGPVIYTGTAYPRPGETDIYARINDVCADYLRHAIPAPGQRFTASAISLGLAGCCGLRRLSRLLRSKLL